MQLQFDSQTFFDEAQQYKNALDNILGSIKKTTELKTNDKFRLGIQSLVKKAEQTPGQKVFCITQVCNEFDIQRRRLYDVINVLESMGVIKKATVDAFVWLGFQNIPPTIDKLLETYGFPNCSSLYAKFFSYNQHISIATLTEYFILCFFIFHKPSLYIKQIAHFLSRENGRYKTTLCKLYQVTHILESAGIIERSMVPGELSIVPTVFRPKPVPQQQILYMQHPQSQITQPQSPSISHISTQRNENESKHVSLLSIESLLN